MSNGDLPSTVAAAKRSGTAEDVIRPLAVKACTLTARQSMRAPASSDLFTIAQLRMRQLRNVCGKPRVLSNRL